MDDFEGKAALVTGAASGIGAAIARELAARGAKVMAADRDADLLAQVVEAIKGDGGTASAVTLDVSDAGAVEAAVTRTQESFGRLDLAVNNAGIGGPLAPVGAYPLEGWRSVMSVNLDGVFYGLRYQIPAMLEGGGGAIVNMASILGTVGFANAGAYVATKHAVVGLTKVAAMEYATQGIRVNAVAPAFIDTPLVTRSLDADALAGIEALHPVQRLGTVAEVSALTCFLLSERASFITGSCHLVDGGYTAQ